MDYIGSKEKINEWIFGKILLQCSNNTNGIVFLDACSGSGSVSRYAAKLGFDVISNDIMKFPGHITNGSIGIDGYVKETAPAILNKLNQLNGVEGFFYKNYSEDAGRFYFTNENAKKLDAIRLYIENLECGDLKLRDYLLYCSLEAMSRVSNTTGVQAAFLKEYKDRARRAIELRLEQISPGKIRAFSSDILSLLKSNKFRSSFTEEILYIDPPYNERQYGPNYHLYETFVKYDEPIIYGKTGLRDWKNENKSPFCSKATCLNFTKDVIENTTAKHIFISYSSDGLIPIIEFQDYLFLNGICNSLTVHSMIQKRYKSDSSVDRNYNENILKEYLIEVNR